MRPNLFATDIPLPATRTWPSFGGPDWRALDDVGRRWHAACRPVLWRRWETRHDDGARVRERPGLIVAARSDAELRHYLTEVAAEELRGGFRACAVPILEEVDDALRWSTLPDLLRALKGAWWPGRWRLTWRDDPTGTIRVRTRDDRLRIGTLSATFPST